MFSTKVAKVRDVYIGGSHCVKIQTMYDDKISRCDVDSLLLRIANLKNMGCDLIRFCYIDSSDYDKFKILCEKSIIPLVADIHFDYKMALEALDAGAHKIRINPGNLSSRWKVDNILDIAKDKGVAIRIGLNSGSLPQKYGKDPKQAMLGACEEYLTWFEERDFYNTVVSLKASDPILTLDVNRELKKVCDYPIHLGVTEAGGLVSSLVKSTWSLGSLLNDNIGDTVRISITGSIEDEVHSAGVLLRTLGLRKNGINIVSCPRCGRYSFDTTTFLNRVQNRLLTINKDITVAFMGCLVNGPGEAKNADIAITGINNEAYLYKHGKFLKKIDASAGDEELFEVIDSL